MLSTDKGRKLSFHVDHWTPQLYIQRTQKKMFSENSWFLYPEVLPPTSSAIGKVFQKNEAEKTVSHSIKSTSASVST